MIIQVHLNELNIKIKIKTGPHSLYRQLLLCRVVLGKSFLQLNAMKIAHAPPGHHSVIGRPSSGGLSHPEYVVYRGEQVSLLPVNFVVSYQFRTQIEWS